MAPEDGLNTVLASVNSDSRARSPEVEESSHDFGRMLADQQTLRHDFVITNRSPRPMSLLGAEPMTPCCSTVGPLSKDPIPPGGTGKVPVLLKTGGQTGARRVEFVVRTDSPEQPTRTLTLRASLLAEWEADTDGPITPLRMGQGGRVSVKLTARRMNDRGRSLPDIVTAVPPLAAEFATAETAGTTVAGLEERIRKVAVTLPASAEAGRQAGELQFSWSDGRSEPFGLAWEVKPWVEASPGCLVVDAGTEDQERRVRLVSRERPIAVKSISGPAVVGFTVAGGPGKRGHALDLTVSLNASRSKTAASSDVVIEVDHPDQPRVAVSVVVVPLRTGRSDATQ